VTGETGDTILFVFRGSHIQPLQLGWYPSVLMNDALLTGAASSSYHHALLISSPLLLTMIIATVSLLFNCMTSWSSC
jgi:hypothetical protein